MPAGSSKKRERQYEHIKESYEKRGQKGRAEEIAARTVNKERAEHGETKSGRSSASGGRSKSGSSGGSSSRASAGSRGSSGPSRSGSSSRSGGSSRSSSSGSSSRSGSSRSSSKPSARGESRSGGESTRAELYEQARRKGVEGRSRMNKAELERAVRK